MAKDPFEEKLGKMIIKRFRESEKIFEQEMIAIANILGDSIIDEEYEIPDFSDALDCAKTYDAAYNLCRHIFYNENCKKLRKNILIKTIECTWDYDYDKFRDKIEEIFYSEGLSVEKGLVYIFWTASPIGIFVCGRNRSRIKKT